MHGVGGAGGVINVVEDRNGMVGVHEWIPLATVDGSRSDIKSANG